METKPQQLNNPFPSNELEAEVDASAPIPADVLLSPSPLKALRDGGTKGVKVVLSVGRPTSHPSNHLAFLYPQNSVSSRGPARDLGLAHSPDSSFSSPLGKDLSKMQCIFDRSTKQGGWVGLILFSWWGWEGSPSPSTKLEGNTCTLAQVLPSVFPSPLKALSLPRTPIRGERGIKGVRVPFPIRHSAPREPESIPIPPSTKLEGSTCAKAQVLPSVFLSPSPLMALRERGTKGVRVPPPHSLNNQTRA